MKKIEKIKSVLFGGSLILLSNLISQNDWGFTLVTAIIFIVGAFILPPLITFMSDSKKDNYYKE